MDIEDPRFFDEKGFPTPDNPYAPGPPFNTPVLSPNVLLVLTNLKPK